MRAGCCEKEPLVGIDMLAQDGACFAHGHFQVEVAEMFWRALGEAIVDARALRGRIAK